MERTSKFPVPEIPAELAEGLDDVKAVDKFLKEYSAAGVLIGGKAHGFMAGAHQVEIDKRKDTDVLVISGGTMMPHDSPYDLFLSGEDGAFRNRNDFTLPYHIHYLGCSLKPGLYLPPPEVVFLTENEMSTRRAVDRVVPEIIEKRYGPMAAQFKQLKLADVVLEFPGDFSWFGSVNSPFPVQIINKRESGGRRTFISFKWRPDTAIPRSAFPSEKDVRAPEMNLIDAFPAVELSTEAQKKIGMDLIEAGFVKQGVDYLLACGPIVADDMDVLCKIFNYKKKYPIQCCEAFGLWLKAAKEQSFSSLVLLDSNIYELYGVCSNMRVADKDIAELAQIISREYGGRYHELVERLAGFSFDNILPEDFNNKSAEHQDFLKRILLSFLGAFNSSKKGSKNAVHSIEDGRGVSHCVVTSRFSLGRGDMLFEEAFYDVCEAHGITDEEIVDHLVTEDTVRAIFENSQITSYLSELEQLQRLPIADSHLDQRIVRSDQRTFLELIRARKYNFLDILFDVIKRRTYQYKDEHRGREIGKIALICGFGGRSALRDKVDQMDDDYNRRHDFRSGDRRNICSYFNYD